MFSIYVGQAFVPQPSRKQLCFNIPGTGKGVEINGENRKIETVVVSLTGDIDLNEISKLTDKMNIPGGSHLEKGN